MTSKQVVRSIFGLSSKERIFDDFSCAYKHKILLHGRIYLTENNICFYSNVLGIKYKTVIDLKKITEIKKKNTLGIFSNALKISTDDNQSYKFSSFSNRNVAYKSIVALWKNVSKYAKDVDVDEDDEGSNQEDSEIEEEKNEIDQPSGAAGKSVNGELSATLDEEFQDPSSSIINPKYKLEKDVPFEGKKSIVEGNNDLNLQAVTEQRKHAVSEKVVENLGAIEDEVNSKYTVTRRNYPQEGDTFHEFTTRENYPLPLTKK